MNLLRTGFAGRALVVAVALTIMPCGRAWSQPANPPGARGDGPRRGPGMLLERVQGAIEELRLSTDQQSKIDSIFDDARDMLRSMGPELRDMDPTERQQRTREFFTDLREKVVAVLDDEQKPIFEQKMDELRQNPGPGDRAGRWGGALERFRAATSELDLTEEQRGKVETVLNDAREKMHAIREETGGDRDAMRGKIRELMDETRSQLQEILTPEQQGKFRAAMSQGDDRPGGRARGGAEPGAPMPPPPPAPPTPPAEPPKDAPPGQGPRAMAPPGALDPGGGPTVGQEAPAFILEKLDGRNVQLSSFGGKILVILFGNYSSPSFRQRAAAFEEFKRENGRRAEFLIIYTRESHPVGESQVERNKQAGISVEQPADIKARKALARQASEALKLSVPIAIDTMEDKTAREYGVTTTAAIIVGRDGVIMARQNWFDPHWLDRELELLSPTRRPAAISATTKPA